MGIDINLLQNQKDYNRLDNMFRIGRVTVAVVGVVCLVTLIVVFGLKRNAQSSLNDALDRKIALQQELVSLQDQETRIILINEKMQSMNEILAENPDYSRQVETFLAYLPESSSSGRLDRIALDGMNGDIIMSFQGVIPLSRFLAILESEQFKQSFAGIQVGSIQINSFNNELQLSLDVTFQ